MSQAFTDDNGGSGSFAPDKSYGVWGNSDSGYGVAGNALSGNGLQGGSISGFGAVGTSQSGDGVVGVSSNGYGVKGIGGDIGVYAHNSTKDGNDVYLATAGLAGDFYGDIYVHGEATVTGDILLINADCAEEFDALLDDKIEPGTVMVLDDAGLLRESRQAYDKTVAGVVSGAGNYRPAIVLDKNGRTAQDGFQRIPLALLGKVYCKADARYSPIGIGDLLTTSPTPGHAMKAGDPSQAFGAVIGKALRPLREGQGMIPILVALQ